LKHAAETLDDLEYSKICLSVMRKHLEEGQCNHTIKEIAAEADSKANQMNGTTEDVIIAEN
jgi:hypothetical protein